MLESRAWKSATYAPARSSTVASGGSCAAAGAAISASVSKAALLDDRSNLLVNLHLKLAELAVRGGAVDTRAVSPQVVVLSHLDRQQELQGRVDVIPDDDRAANPHVFGHELRGEDASSR